MKTHHLFLLAATALLLALHTPAHAGFTLPPELQGAGEEEKLRYLRQMGEQSLREKIAAGHQRYDERLAFRQEIIQGMRSNAAERRGQILAAVPSAPVETSKEPGHVASTVLWLALALCAGFLLVRIARRQLIQLPLAERRPTHTAG